MWLAWLLLAVVTALITRFLVWALSRITFRPHKRHPVAPLNTRVLVVLGSGGHTAEMLQLTAGWKHYALEYVLSDTDTTSAVKLEPGAVVHRIPRSREVGQSWSSTVLSTLKAFWWCLWLHRRRRPGLLLCNGPGTCVPLIFAALSWELCLLQPRYMSRHA
eukprot:GEMP01100646.1.p1 GENE.GEMP01100646.1~~GEMP01100646.1.p1  ORF type:complete len:161 (+),score=39.07 GEMP01100646.1:28-510(+)